ncbi:MAG: ribonuclease HII [Candidatus Vogelbacteria bacterium]|nr:ribonuclease HII [Candidatus Vogelbacteria bacterium]
MAGPVAVAAVVMSRAALDTRGLNDSKVLTSVRREAWYEKLTKARRRRQLNFTVALVGEKTIDRLGIVRAVAIGIRRCLARLKLNPKQCRVLLDGSLHAPRIYQNQKTIIRGDSRIKIIMLASIAAKVRRDRRLRRLAGRYPGYDFEIHKGYGTKKHYAALRRRGLSPLHRRSFLRKFSFK